jgi:multisubunit Na+/H+ antiporter MnhF subunit
VSETVSHAAPDRIRRIFHVAWLAVVLGIVLQLVIFLVRLAAGAKIPAAVFFADLTQNVTWGFIVCVGVAIGVTAGRMRMMLGGLLGLISGPVGWAAAKSMQRSVQAALGAPIDQFTAFFFLMVALKGVEYLLLGLAVGRAADKPAPSVSDYLRPGALIGLVFSAAVVSLNLWNGPVALPKLLGVAVSESLFPIGCALVIWAPTYVRRYAGLSGEAG